MTRRAKIVCCITLWLIAGAISSHPAAALTQDPPQVAALTAEAIAKLVEYNNQLLAAEVRGNSAVGVIDLPVTTVWATGHIPATVVGRPNIVNAVAALIEQDPNAKTFRLTVNLELAKLGDAVLDDHAIRMVLPSADASAMTQEFRLVVKVTPPEVTVSDPIIFEERTFLGFSLGNRVRVSNGGLSIVVQAPSNAQPNYTPPSLRIEKVRSGGQADFGALEFDPPQRKGGAWIYHPRISQSFSQGTSEGLLVIDAPYMQSKTVPFTMRTIDHKLALAVPVAIGAVAGLLLRILVPALRTTSAAKRLQSQLHSRIHTAKVTRSDLERYLDELDSKVTSWAKPAELDLKGEAEHGAKGKLLILQWYDTALASELSKFETTRVARADDHAVTEAAVDDAGVLPPSVAPDLTGIHLRLEKARADIAAGALRAVRTELLAIEQDLAKAMRDHASAVSGRVKDFFLKERALPKGFPLTARESFTRNRRPIETAWAARPASDKRAADWVSYLFAAAETTAAGLGEFVAVAREELDAAQAAFEVIGGPARDLGTITERDRLARDKVYAAVLESLDASNLDQQVWQPLGGVLNAFWTALLDHARKAGQAHKAQQFMEEGKPIEAVEALSVSMNAPNTLGPVPSEGEDESAQYERSTRLRPTLHSAAAVPVQHWHRSTRHAGRRTASALEGPGRFSFDQVERFAAGLEFTVGLLVALALAFATFGNSYVGSTENLLTLFFWGLTLEFSVTGLLAVAATKSKAT